MKAARRNLIFICFSQYGANFSYNFIQVFLPFFILKISPYPMQYTLLWVGVILGAGGLSAAVTSTFWGSLAHRFSPKMLYLRAIMVNVITFFLMGFTTDLNLLLILTILRGSAGGASTIGMIIVSSSSEPEDIPSSIGLFQSAMTLGQLTGPPLGSLAAVMLGYRGAFISGSAVLFASFVFCSLYVIDVPPLPRMARAFGWTSMDRRIIIGWMLCFIAMIHLTFLPSVLPTVLAKLNIGQTVALKLAGTIVMLYTGTAMIGTYIWSRFSRRFGLHRVIAFLLILGIFSQASLAFSRGIVDFTVLRMIQTGVMAAIIPLVISIFAGESKGDVIGFMNSARFTGGAIGPIFATSILAVSNLPSLYFSISTVTFFALLGFMFFFRDEPKAPEW